MVQPSLLLASTSAPRPVFTPEEMTSAIVDLSHLRALIQGQLVIQPPQLVPPPPPPLPLSLTTSVPLITYPYGMPSDAMPSGSVQVTTPPPLPIHQIPFPRSPSQIPMGPGTLRATPANVGAGLLVDTAPHRPHSAGPRGDRLPWGTARIRHHVRWC